MVLLLLDGWMRDDSEADAAGMSEDEYEQQVAMLAGDYAPERLREMRRANLGRLAAEQRNACYREMELRVVAHSKEELEITGLFGTEFVFVERGLTVFTCPCASISA